MCLVEGEIRRMENDGMEIREKMERKKNVCLVGSENEGRKWWAWQFSLRTHQNSLPYWGRKLQWKAILCFG